MKIGIDIHGVIDRHRSFFSDLTQLIKRDNERIGVLNAKLCSDNHNTVLHSTHEVHILTGPMQSKLGNNELDGIYFTHFFSIVSWMKEQGQVAWYKEEDYNHTEPWFDNVELWNKAKGLYAEKNNLHLMIDDTQLYVPSFSTPIAIMQRNTFIPLS